MHRGIAAPLAHDNIDTDTITPSRDISMDTSRLGEACFAPWRYLDVYTRAEKPDFVLNRPAFRKASILVSGRNFGCGSSRETAVWALQQIGMRCVIAQSFGAIFRSNCIRNGLLPAVVEAAVLAQLHAEAIGGEFEVDLETREITTPAGRRFPFSIDALERRLLLEGLDAIALTLKWREEILNFQAADRERRPWIWQTVDG